MTECIPDRLPASATNGEKRLFKILSGLPGDCVVYYEPIVENRYADFIVLIPSLGVIVIEVKGWKANEILGGDLENVMVVNRWVEQWQRHPIRQAREYMISLMHTCQRHKAFKRLIHADGPHQGQFLFPFGYFSVLSNATRTQIQEAGKSILFSKNKVMSRDEFLAWEGLSPDASLNLLKSYFDPWWPLATPLTDHQIDSLRAIIHPEVVLFSFMDETKGLAQESIKVLDIRQENHARNIGHGHRIIYGVPGSGKTVILVARAKLLACANSAKQHLFLCFNVALAHHLRCLLKGCDNIVVRHFHLWAMDYLGGRMGARDEDNDGLGERLLAHLQSGKGKHRKYCSVYLDEAQDFAESWFKCALEVMEDSLDGDIVIVGDGKQGLYRHRDFTWASVGIQAVGRTINTRFDLDRCYRSTKEVISLAQGFGTGGTDKAEVAIASMRVDPDRCTRSSGFKPVIVGCAGAEDECKYAALIAKELLGGKWFGRDLPKALQPSEIGILYRNAGGDKSRNLLLQLEKEIEQAIWLNIDGRKSLARITESGVKIQTIHSAKGLQYKAVILLWAGQMPSTKANDDLQTERRLMFVGLTRAEEYLTVLYSTRATYVEELKATGAADLLEVKMLDT
jgi:hypothetical protein